MNDSPAGKHGIGMNEANDDRCFITAFFNTAAVESLSGASLCLQEKKGLLLLHTDAISSGPMFAIESEYALS